MLHELYTWMLSWANSPYGTYALFALSFAESSFFPIPPDVLLIALCIANPEQSFWFALVCTVASTLGGMFGYGIGYVGGKPILRRLIRADKLALIHDYFQRYEAWAIGIAGFTPVPYKLFTISAGAFWINFWKFVLVSFVSRGGRFFLVATLIWLFGETIRHLIERYFELFTLAFVALIALGFYFVHHHGKKAMTAPEREDS